MSQAKDPREGPQRVPVGLAATGARTETDALGAVEVPANHYWGAQTQRALAHFGEADPLPPAFYHSYAAVKRACALVSGRSGALPEWKAAVIAQAAAEVMAGELDGEFPVGVWQSGSGTQSNMNLNEVIANRASQLAGGELGRERLIHPNDDVNLAQSTNDTFAAAAHVSAVLALTGELLPSLERLRYATARKSEEWAEVVKIGRTHLQDATPLTVGQEWSGYAAVLDDAMADLAAAATRLRRLALGGTAVGTGLNAPAGFGEAVAAEVSALMGEEFSRAGNLFAAQSSLSDLVRASSAVRGAAIALFKFANDVRWAGSGPRAGLGELVLPAGEPGSSIMPGKVNPSQAEALLMTCLRVMGDDAVVAMAGAEGNFELNAFRPVAIASFLGAVRVLAAACERFRAFCVEGTELNEAKLADDVARSVMLVTALSPVIGYDRAAAIAHLATDEDLTLREAALRSGVSGDVFDAMVEPGRLTRPGTAGDASPAGPVSSP